MAVIAKNDARKFLEMDDRMIDILDYLRDKKIIDDLTHRKILLGGYFRLVEYLEVKKHLSKQQARDALANGFDSLIEALS